MTYAIIALLVLQLALAAALNSKIERLTMTEQDEDWLIKAIQHLSHQVQRVEFKVNILLDRHPDIDLSKEDLSVLAGTKDLDLATQDIKNALARIPPPKVPPV